MPATVDVELVFVATGFDEDEPPELAGMTFVGEPMFRLIPVIEVARDKNDRPRFSLYLEKDPAFTKVGWSGRCGHFGPLACGGGCRGFHGIDSGNA